MLPKFSIFLGLVICINLNAQNLLPNGAFEDINICCENTVGCCPSGWFKTNFSKYTSTNYPREGLEGSNGIEIVASAIGGNNYRTYLQVPILCSLQKGKSYQLSMYIKPKQFILDELGAYFSDTFTITFSDERLTVPYQLKFKNGKKFLGKKNTWKKVSANYIANGHEQFLIIGNFKVDSLLYWKRINKKSEMCIYAIDSVSLTPINHKVKCDTDSLSSIYYAETRRHNYKKSCAGSINLFENKIELPLTNNQEQDTFLTQKAVILKNVFFEFDKTILLPPSFKELDVLVHYLKSHPNYAIHITGHTDSKGTNEYNQKLSTGRAIAVGNYLIKQGILPIRITSEGKASTEPIADNSSEEGREQNRRVEFFIIE